jgi:F-type H+-transporting ATPase subunit epsilon
MAELRFELVAPERLLYSGVVAQVVVPGSEGEFTVLPQHAPVLSTLKPGVLTVTGLDGGSSKIFVRGGFAEVNPAGLTVLAEEAIPLAELSPDLLDQQIRDAEEDLADAEDEHVRLKAQEAVDHLRQLRGSLSRH